MYNINNKQIGKTRIIKSEISDVWWKWTTHEGLQTFFGKDNKIELRLNGFFEIYFLMDNEYGLRGSEGCRVLSYIPEKMLSFSWNASPEYMEIRNHEHQTWVVINFEPVGEKTTRVDLKHLGWLNGEQWDLAYEYFDKAWDTVLDWLEKSYE